MAGSINKTYFTPGVVLEQVFPEPAWVMETGVPVFIGLIRKMDLDALDGKVSVKALPPPGILRVVAAETNTSTDSRFPVFNTKESVTDAFGDVLSIGFLEESVRGFFENGGKKCVVYPVCFDDSRVLAHEALNQALMDLENLEGIDLICVPDIVWLCQEDENVTSEDVIWMQNLVLSHCMKKEGRFAILDSLPNADTGAVILQRKKLVGDNGALYYPWLKTRKSEDSEPLIVPPCGHVCGIYARCDEKTGVHKAPANEEIEGVTDMETGITAQHQDLLNPEHVNCIRSFPGRGIRVWGARTLSRQPEWTYVNVRRLFLTLERWLSHYMTGLVFEPNDPVLWGRINRELNQYLNSLFLKGAFKGETPKEAFFIRCDETTNTEESRDAGRVITEIGVAPSVPCEFIVIRIIHSDSGVRIMEASDAELPHGETASSVAALPAVVISHIEYSVRGRDVLGEYAVIENRDTRVAALGNWTLTDLAGHVFRFPQFDLPPGGQCRIWTRQGTNTGIDLYWGLNAAIWNNEGDQAILRDKQGRTVNIYEYVP